MPWFRIDDSFCDHPKVLAAGNAAVGLFVRSLSYCAYHLTDGFVPVHAARILGTRREIDTLRTGFAHYGPLWVDVNGGYQIPDYLEYNPSRAEVLADRVAKHEAKVEAGRRGGIASGVARRKLDGLRDEAEPKQNRSNVEANTKQKGKRNGSETKPRTRTHIRTTSSLRHEVATENPQPVDISTNIRKATRG